MFSARSLGRNPSGLLAVPLIGTRRHPAPGTAQEPLGRGRRDVNTVLRQLQQPGKRTSHGGKAPVQTQQVRRGAVSLEHPAQVHLVHPAPRDLLPHHPHRALVALPVQRRRPRTAHAGPRCRGCRLGGPPAEAGAHHGALEPHSHGPAAPRFKGRQVVTTPPPARARPVPGSTRRDRWWARFILSSPPHPLPADPAPAVMLFLVGLRPGVIADVAQLVAHHLAKVRVAGSNPVVRSRGHAASGGVAERRGNGLQSRLHGFESRLHLAHTNRAIGAVVARFLDTEEVTGSNPVSPTQ